MQGHHRRLCLQLQALLQTRQPAVQLKQFGEVLCSRRQIAQQRLPLHAQPSEDIQAHRRHGWPTGRPLVAQGFDQRHPLGHAFHAMPLAARQGKRGGRLQVCAVVFEQCQAPLLHSRPIYIGTGRMTQLRQLFAQRNKLTMTARITAQSNTHFK
ncbi:hypothetical protein D3C85_1058260 [compost metagenome]